MKIAEGKVKDLESQAKTAEKDHEAQLKDLRAQETELTGNVGSLKVPACWFFKVKAALISAKLSEM